MDDGSCKRTGAAAAGNPVPADQNTSPTNPPPTAAAGDHDAAAASSAAAAAEGRRPFTSLSHEEADLALARVLQEQERAYMMLTGQGGGGGYGMLEDGDGYDDYEDDDEEDGAGEEDDASDYEEEGDGEAIDEDDEVGDAEGAEDDLDLDLDPARFVDDEAYARALQDAKARDVTGRLMALAGFGDWRAMQQDDDDEDDEEDDQEDGNPQDAWEDVDPDEYSYEELVALGEVVGTESKGLPADTIASLPSVTYQAQYTQDGNMEQCVICRVEFDDGESLVALPCKHAYHAECINHWLQLNKVCPMCSAEVSTSVNKQDSKHDFNNGKK